MPGVLNLFFLSASTLLALACFLACVFTDPGRCGSVHQAKHCLHSDMLAYMLVQVHTLHLCSVPEDNVPGAYALPAFMYRSMLHACVHARVRVYAVHLRSVPEDYVPGAADAVVQVKRKVPPHVPSACITHSRNSCIAVSLGLRVWQ